MTTFVSIDLENLFNKNFNCTNSYLRPNDNGSETKSNIIKVKFLLIILRRNQEQPQYLIILIWNFQGSLKI